MNNNIDHTDPAKDMNPKRGNGGETHRMNQIWKLNGILDKEDGHVVTHDVPVTLFGIDFDPKCCSKDAGC